MTPSSLPSPYPPVPVHSSPTPSGTVPTLSTHSPFRIVHPALFDLLLRELRACVRNDGGCACLALLTRGDGGVGMGMCFGQGLGRMGVRSGGTDEGGGAERWLVPEGFEGEE